MLDSIGTKIKDLRIKNKLSQKDLCGDFMDRTILSKIENNNMIPSIEQLLYICEKVQVNISYFFKKLNFSDCNNNYDCKTYSLSELYTNEKYEEITKFIEFNYDEFNRLEHINKTYYCGMSYFNLKLYNESIKFLRKYINSYFKVEHNIQEKEVINFAISLNTLGKIMLRNSNYRKMKLYLHIAKKYLNNYNKCDSLINFIIHNNLGYAYNSSNDFNKTISILEEFLTLNQNMSYLLILPHIHLSLNIAYYNVSNYEASIKHIEKSIYLFEYNDDYINTGRCYINYINSLRYSRKFDEAFGLINKYKDIYKNDRILHIKFLLQEIIVNFNTGNYNRILSLLNTLNIKDLEKINKHDIYFISGHIHYLNNNFFEAHSYLLKCEKHFVNRNYTYDLTLIYKDLYTITKSSIYLDKYEINKNIKGRKNVLVPFGDI